MEIIHKILELVNTEVPSANATISEFRGDFVLTVKSEPIVQIANLLKNHPELQFKLCEDITAVDWATRKNRFSVVYHLFSLLHSFRLRVVTVLEGEETKIDTVSSVWKTANWQEREAYDMFGLEFNNHPDFRRMYMPEEFEYYPLRKEFPLLGIPGSLPLPKK